MSVVCGKEKDETDVKSSPQDNPGRYQNNQHHSGDPVNLVTGAFSLDEQDVSFPSQRLTINLTRHYDSIQHNQAIKAEPFGWGWTHSLNLFLIKRVVGTEIEIDYIDGRGAVITFKRRSPNGSYSPPPGSLGLELNITPQGGFLLRQVDGLLAEFDLQGKIISLIRPGPIADSRLEFIYDELDRLVSVQGAGGRALSFLYKGKERLISSVKDHTCREWRYRYDQHQNLIQVRDPSGRIRSYSYRYKKVDVTRYKESDDSTEITPRSIKGLYQVYSPAQEKEQTERIPVVTNQYTSEFRVFQQTDALGGITRYDYNRFNRTTGLTDPSGWTTLYCYDKQGNTTKIRQPEGGITEYIFDERKNLVAEIDPIGERTLYVELKNNELLDQQLEFGRRAFGNRSDYITVPLEEISIGYDSNGNRSLRRDALGNTFLYQDYNRFGKPQRIVLPNGDIVCIQYDKRSGLPLSVEQVLKAGYCEPQRWTQKYQYDSWGNLIRQEEWCASENGIQSPHRIAEQEFDESGMHPISRRSWIEGGKQLVDVDQVFGEEKLIWDELGRLKELQVIRRSNMEKPVEILKTQWGYDSLDQLIWQSKPDGTTKCFQYDLNGQLIESYLIEKASQQNLSSKLSASRKMRQQWFYDQMGHLIRSKDPTGAVTVREYDARGLCTRLIEPTGFTTEFKYDQDGREILRSTSLGYQIRFGYDIAGRLVRQIDNCGLELNWTYDALGKVIKETEKAASCFSSREYTYDSLGRLVEIGYPDGAYKRMTYDERGMLIRRERGPKPTAVEVHKYDGLGRLVEVLAGDSTAQRRLFEYRFDDVRRCVETVDALGNMTRNYFDTTDSLIRSEDAEGQSLDFEYDLRGRLIQKKSSDTSISSNFMYDYAGRLVMDREGDILNRWNYDPSGRMVEHYQQAQQKSRSLKYQYDDSSRIIGKSSGSNWWMKYEYRPGTSFISQITLPGQKLTIQSDLQGRIVEERWQNGNYIQYDYLPNGLLNKKDNFDEQNKLVFGQRFLYDDWMRWCKEERRIGSKLETYQYTFDHINRLKRVDLINDQVPSEFRRYEYDCFDNRLEEHRQGKIWKTWHYDSANRIVEEKDSQGQQRIYEHDRRGNLVRRGQDTFLYDAGSRLRRVYQAGSNHALLEFSYSATGQRTLITNKFDVEWVIFDKLNEIISISPNCERVTYWGLQADQALAYSKNTPANISPVFTDASHSLIRVMGEQDECKYDPFGNPINNISKDFHFGFNGKRYYPELDFYENRARFYDPNCGRFTQPDPLGIKSDGPNLYHYARNNPIQFIDTLGLKSQQTSYGKISNLLSGGHLVEKHVGKSLDYLQQRLATENINVASSFTNLQSANKVIAATLDNSQKDIDRWLENGLSPRLSVEYSGSSKIGYGIIRGESDVRSFSDASIVLERSSSSSAGFFILTGYPTPS